MAFSIGVTEVATKIILYFFHERAWNNWQWGRNTEKPNNFRSLFKSLTWRAVGTLDTITVSLFYSRDLSAAALIGGTETITKVALFYLHERLWAVIRWGRYDLGIEKTKEVL